MHAEQFAGQLIQVLFPGLYYPVLQVVGFTQAVPSKAIEELHPHFPVVGVLVKNEGLHFEQNPVLLQVVQFEGQGMHLFVPSLY